MKAAVVVCSDSIYNGENEDTSGKIIVQKLQELELGNIDYLVVPDEVKEIQQALSHL
uniref:Molybdopterin-binding protein n=1 Tax=Chryseobacterium endophyticum TaxID=1854762 RepID=A0AAU6WNJ4_9FLAO